MGFDWKKFLGIKGRKGYQKEKPKPKPKPTGTQKHRGGGSNNTGRGGTRSGGNSNTYNNAVNNARSNAGVSNNNRGGGYNNRGNNRGGNNNRGGYNQASSRTNNQGTSTIRSRAQTAAEQAYQRKQESERRMQEAKAKRDAAAKKRKEQMAKDAKERREKRRAEAAKRREGLQTATNERKAGAKRARENETAQNVGRVAAGTAKYFGEKTARDVAQAATWASKQAAQRQGFGNKGKSGQQHAPTKADRLNDTQKTQTSVYKAQTKKNKEQTEQVVKSNYKDISFVKSGEKAVDKLKDAEQKTLNKAASGFSDKKTHNIFGKEFSNQDIVKGGIKLSKEMADYLLPYGGTTKGAMKAAEGILKAGKAAKAGKVLTEAGEAGGKVLSKDGKKVVREFAERVAKGEEKNAVLKDITKKVSRSDLKQNIKKELLANAMQDATIGTAIDAVKGKQEGLKGKDFWKYMGESAAMNAVIGSPVAAIAGRTGKAGKNTLKSDIKKTINVEYSDMPKVSKEQGDEIIKLVGKEKSGTITKPESNRLTELSNNIYSSRGGVVQINKKGKLVVNDGKSAKSVLSPKEQKDYISLQTQYSMGTLPKEKAKHLRELDAKVKTAYQVAERNAEITLEQAKRGATIDRDMMESMVQTFRRTGDDNRLKQAEKILDTDKKATFKRNKSMTKAVDTLSAKTGTKYRLVTDDQMREIAGRDIKEDEFAKGYFHENEKGEIEILINRDSPQAHQTVIGHETGHLIKANSEEEFDKLGEMLIQYSKDREEFDAFEAEMRRNYPEFADIDGKMDPRLKEEITCELLGRYIFGEDDTFIRKLAGEQPSVARRIIEYVKNLAAKITDPDMAKQLNTISDEAEKLIGKIDGEGSAKPKYSKNGNGLNQVTISHKMSDADRAKVLNKAAIEPAMPNPERIATSLKEFEDIMTQTASNDAERTLKTIGGKFGIFGKDYYNHNIDLHFEYSRRSAHKSTLKQAEASGDFGHLAKAMSCFDDVIDRAVPIEVHTDRYVGTHRQDANHVNTFVLISAMKDSDSVMPVELIVNERKGNQKNTLYVTVVLEENKKKTINESGLNRISGDTDTMSSEINIADLISKVNPNDSDFLKYVPDDLLTTEQIKGKSKGLLDEKAALRTRRKETLDKISKLESEIDVLKKEGKPFKSKEINLGRYKRIVEDHRSDYEADGLLQPKEQGTNGPAKAGSFNGRYSKSKTADAAADQVAYKTLVSKPNMSVAKTTGTVPKLENGKVDKQKLIKEVKERARAKGNSKNTETEVYVRNNDQGIDIRLDSYGIKHGTLKGAGAIDTAEAELGLPDIIENAVLVNYLHPRGKTQEARLFVGAVTGERGTYIVRFKVETTDESAFSANEFEFVDKLTGAKAKKVAEPTKGKASASPYLNSATDTVSIEDLLRVVNDKYPDVLSSDVLAKFGKTKDEVAVSFGKDPNLTAQTRFSKAKEEKQSAKIGEIVNNTIPKEDREYVSEVFDYIVDCLKKGDNAQAEAQAKALAEDFGDPNDVHIDYDARRELKEIQDSLREVTIHMPQSDGMKRKGAFKDFKEALGAYDPYILHIRKSTTGKNPSIGIDEIWKTLDEEHPGMFPKDLPEDEKFRFLADLSTRRMEDTDLRIPTPDEYIDGEYEAMARDILDEARTVANPKPAKEEVVNTPKQEELQPEVEQPKESEESQPAAEQPKESEEQQVMAAEIPKSKKEQKEEIKAAERQEAIDRGIDVDAYDDAKVSYTDPQSMSKSDIDKEMKRIYFANKNAKTDAHTKVRNERKKALEDEIQRRKDEQPAYAALSDDQLADKDPGWSIANDDIVRDDSAPTEPAKKGTFKSVNKGDNVIMPKSTWRTSFRRLLVNSMTGFEDFAKANKDNKMLSQINNVQHITNKIASWVEGDRSGMNRKISGKGLNAIFEDSKLFGPKNIERKNDFTNYVTYKHAIDRLEQEKPVHMGPDGESLYTKEDYQKMMGDLEEKYGKEALESFTDDICGYFDDLLQMRVDSGLITQKFADGLRAKYKTYIPTMREGDDWLLNGIDNSRKQEFGVDNNIRKATGGSADIMDLYQSAMMITRDVIRDAEENELLRQYARALGADPSHVAPDALGELPSFAAHVANADGGWRVSFFQDGQMVTMPVDKQIAKGLREINGQDYRRLMNISTKGQKPMRIFKGLITDYNLIFGVRNGARDIQQAAVNSKSLTHFSANIPTAQASVLRKNIPGLESDPWMKSYEANGGLYSTFVRQDDKFGGAGSQKYVEPGSEKGAKKAIDKTAGKALRAIEAANSAIEATPRLAEYIGTIKKDVDAQLRSEGSSLKKFKQELQDELYGAGKELTEEQTEKFSDEFAKRVLDMASTDTIEKAARNAADITLNFSRNGVIGKALNMGWVPYFNPSVQGLSKTVRMFTENGAEGAKSLLNFGMKLGTLTMAPAVINEVLCADNRDYQNLATREKDSNFFIPLGDGKFVKIPKPRENSVLAEPVTYGLRYFMDKAHVGTIEPGEYSQWKDLGQFFVSMKDNIGPANPMNDNIFSPIVRLAQNKTWYGGSIESVSELLGKKEGELKNSEIADNTTSAWAIAIGQQKIGNTTISDLTHMSPKKIDDLMDSYLGVIYDLGISQTAEVTNGNPFVNQFIKDSVFSNKNGTELWAEFGKANEPKTTGGKIKQKAKDAVFGHSVLNINEKTLEAKDWLNQKGYDDITYSDAINKIREDKSFTDKQKENIIRNWKKAQNNLRHELIYGSKEVSYKDDPLKVIAKTVGVDKAMTDYTYTSENPETGKKNNQHLDAWKAYKNSAEYKKDKEKGGQKFIDFYAKMRWTNGRIGESKSYPQWMTASILAATEKGNNDALAKAYIRPDGWEDGVSTGKLDPDYQEKIVQRGKNYRDYGFDQAYYRKSQRAIFKAGRALKYEYTSKMNPWDEAMALSTHKAEFLDGAYYSSDTSGKVSRRMNYARCLDKKGYSTKQIYDFAKEYDLKLPDTKGMSKQEAGQAWKAFDDKVEAAVRDKYGDKPKEEQAAVYHVITDDTYHQPFGEVGDYSKKGDTGITDLDARENSGWGHRGRRRRGHRRGGWGHGGGGSGGGGGSSRATKVPETTPKKLTAKKSSAKRSSGGAAKVSTPEVHVDFKKGVTPNVQHTVNYKPYKAKAANLFTMKDYTKPSNLDDAYRKKAKKLREASRKKLS